MKLASIFFTASEEIFEFYFKYKQNNLKFSKSSLII